MLETPCIPWYNSDVTECDNLSGADNQQERQVDLAFVAGLTTGEGCFSLTVQAGKRITPVFCLFMNDHDSIRMASSKMNSLGLRHRLYLRKDKNYLGIQVNGGVAVGYIARTLAPHLGGTKKRAAEIMAEYTRSRQERERGSAYTDHEWGLVYQLREVNGRKKGSRLPVSSTTTRWAPQSGDEDIV